VCVFPGLFCIGILAPLHVVICESVCHLLPPVFFWLQVFMCVCAQVCCSVVCNWSMCDLFVDVCFLICSGFNLLSFVYIFSFLIFLVLRHQTTVKVYKHNLFNTNTPSSEFCKKNNSRHGLWVVVLEPRRPQLESITVKTPHLTVDRQKQL
jgi:predicted membrane protein